MWEGSLTVLSDHLTRQRPWRSWSGHLRSSDGLAAVLTWRDADVYSRYIYFEILLAVRARKPVLVFVEDRLPDDVLPRWILQRRFSRRFYGRQVRELRRAVAEFTAYVGDDPPGGTAPTPRRGRCVVTGLDPAGEPWSQVQRVLAARGYEVLRVDRWAIPPWGEPRWFSFLNDLDVAVCNVGTEAGWGSYLAGVLHASFVPTINFGNREPPADWVPPELLPLANVDEHQLGVVGRRAARGVRGGLPRGRGRGAG